VLGCFFCLFLAFSGGCGGSKDLPPACPCRCCCDCYFTFVESHANQYNFSPTAQGDMAKALNKKVDGGKWARGRGLLVELRLLTLLPSFWVGVAKTSGVEHRSTAKNRKRSGLIHLDRKIQFGKAENRGKCRHNPGPIRAGGRDPIRWALGTADGICHWNI